MVVVVPALPGGDHGHEEVVLGIVPGPPRLLPPDVGEAVDGRDAVDAQQKPHHEAPHHEAPAAQRIQKHDLKDLVQIVALPQPVIEVRGFFVKPRDQSPV